MTPKEKLAHDIIQLVAGHSPYKHDRDLHDKWIMGVLAGELSTALYNDTQTLRKFINKYKRNI